MLVNLHYHLSLTLFGLGHGCFWLVLRIEPRALRMLNMFSATDLCLQPYTVVLFLGLNFLHMGAIHTIYCTVKSTHCSQHTGGHPRNSFFVRSLSFLICKTEVALRSILWDGGISKDKTKCGLSKHTCVQYAHIK